MAAHDFCPGCPSCDEYDRADEARRALQLVKAAEAMFDAYNKHGPSPWKTFDGRDVPRWSELNDAVREKWVAAARVARRLM